MTLSRLALAVLRLGLLGALLPDLAAAQAYPMKPIRIVVPWAPGGSTDVLARLIGIKMSENWGQPAVVENKPGASGNIGSELVAKAAPDEHPADQKRNRARFRIALHLQQELQHVMVAEG